MQSQPRPDRTSPSSTPPVRYQPIRDFRSTHVVGLDAVTRPSGGHGGATSTSERLAHSVCRQIHAWWAADPNRIIPPVTILLRADECTNPDVIDRLLDIPNGHHLPAGCISLAVPELALDAALTGDVSARAQACGATLQVHRYGAGSVSLARLADPAVTVLRLDGGLVAGLPHDPCCLDVVRAAIALGSALDTRVMAENVVDQDQLSCLVDLGCREIQGSLAGRPRTAEAVAQLFLTRGEAITTSSWSGGSSLGTAARITAEISRHELEDGIDHLRSLVDR